MESTYLTYQQARISFWNKIWDKRQNKKDGEVIITTG